jgi:hypothetical protein
MLSEIDELPSLQLGDYVLRFELEEPTEFGQEVALNELRETPENKAEAIIKLKELLRGKLSNQYLYQMFIVYLPI